MRKGWKRKEDLAILGQSKGEVQDALLGTTTQSADWHKQAGQKERRGRVTGLTVDTRDKSS